MLPGYNTNGFAHHRLTDVVAILTEIGYRSVAVTLEHGQLDPPNRRGVDDCVKQLKPLIEATGLSVTIETGSRFILDPRRKHLPTLLSRSPEERRQRIDFIKAAIDVAEALSADSVSLWSGSPDRDFEPIGTTSGFDKAQAYEADHPRPRDSENSAADEPLFARLTDSLGELLQYAGAKEVRLSLEPEPGMFINTMSRFEELLKRIDHPNLGLTLDIGHVCCLDDGEVQDHIRRQQERLWNVHVEDMRHGVHEHLMFGQGDIDFAPVFHTLEEVRYAGPIHVELSRHSHDAVETARQAFEFLRRFF